MPDIDIFDPSGFFDQKIKELEQEMIAKQARQAILQVNRANLERTLMILQSLPEEQQKAIQVEVASLAEAKNQTVRAMDALKAELEVLGVKLAALKAARSLVGAGEVITRPGE